MLEWIITSCFLAAAVFLIRAVLKDKISARLRYALWLALLVRLLIPITVSESPISVLNFTQYFRVLETDRVEVTQSELTTGGEVGETVAPALPFDEAVTARDAAVAVVPTPKAAAFPFTDIAFAVWLVGASILGVCIIITNVSFYLKLRRNRRKITVEGFALPLYVADGLPSPCLFGLFSPSVYVTPSVSYVTPSTSQDKTKLTHVLAHEYTHFRHLDFIWSLLRAAALCLHWYNPLVWFAAAASKRDGELACDEGTIVRLGEAERLDYGKTLLGLVSVKRSPAGLLCSATTMVSSVKSLKERVKYISSKPKMFAAAIVAVVLLAVIATGCAFTGASAKNNTYERFGLHVTLPEDYDGKVTATDAENLSDSTFIELYHDASREKFKGGGWMYSIIRHTSEEFVPDEYNVGSLVYFAKDDAYYYALMRPTDVQTVPDDEKIYGEYDALCEEADAFTAAFTADNALTAYSREDYLKDSELYMMAGSVSETTPAGELLLLSADLGGDGTVEEIYADLTQSESGMYALTVRRGDGEIYRGEANTSHAGWCSFYLTRVDGVAYLLIYNEYSAQGAAEYSLRLFAPDGGDGAPADEATVFFEMSGRQEIDVAALMSFKEKADLYLANAALLLSTEGGTAALYDSDATAGLSVDYSFVDDCPILYGDDDTMSDKLGKFSDYMRMLFMNQVMLSEVNSADCIHGKAYTYPDYHNIDTVFQSHVGDEEFGKWLSETIERSLAENDGGCPYKYANIVQFVRDFGITRDMFEHLYYASGLYYSEYYDADIIYDGTDAEIAEFFSLENSEAVKIKAARETEASLKIELAKKANMSDIYYPSFLTSHSVTGLIKSSGVDFAELESIVLDVCKSSSGYIFTYFFTDALNGNIADTDDVKASDEAFRRGEVTETSNIIGLSSFD